MHTQIQTSSMLVHHRFCNFALTFKAQHSLGNTHLINYGIIYFFWAGTYKSLLVRAWVDRGFQSPNMEGASQPVTDPFGGIR